MSIYSEVMGSEVISSNYDLIRLITLIAQDFLISNQAEIDPQEP